MRTLTVIALILAQNSLGVSHAKPLYVALPLKDLSATSSDVLRTAPLSFFTPLSNGRLALDGIVIEGSRGSGLNFAGRLHDALLAQNLENEISRIHVAPVGTSADRVRTVLRVTFRSQLTGSQRLAAQDVVAGLSAEVPSQAAGASYDAVASAPTARVHASASRLVPVRSFR